MKTTAKAQARHLGNLRAYYGVCGECDNPATYGEIDGVALCSDCAANHGLESR